MTRQQIIDECRMVQLRHNSARLIQLAWRIATLYKAHKGIQPPVDSPPSHRHRSMGDGARALPIL